MNEKEIRERIERFLKKTARNVVVPASVGLGLSLSGCGDRALRVGGADAGVDATSLSTRDARSVDPLDAEAILDTGLLDASPDAGPDLPNIYPPYLIVPPPPDAGQPDLPAAMPVYIYLAEPPIHVPTTPLQDEESTSPPPRKVE